MLDFVRLVEREIAWCEDQSNSGAVSEDYKNGFIAGLKQSLLLLMVMLRSMAKEYGKAYHIDIEERDE